MNSIGGRICQKIYRTVLKLCVYSSNLTIVQMSILGWPPASARDVLKKWESDKLDRIFAKFVSPGPQTYQIKAKRADVVRICRLFSNERTPSQVTDV